MKFKIVFFLSFVLILLLGSLEPLFSQDMTTTLVDDSAETVESEFFELLHSNELEKAQIIMTQQIKRQKLAPEILANMLFALGNELMHGGNPQKAKEWFEILQKDFGEVLADEDEQIHFKALIAPKLDWLNSGAKRLWARKNPVELAEEIEKALGKNDVPDLGNFLAAVDTYVGWWESELEPLPREAVLEHLSKFIGPKTTWVNREEFTALAAKKEVDVLYVNTHGWKDMEGFKNIQFAIHSVFEGWEWRGIVLGETPEVNDDEPKAD